MNQIIDTTGETLSTTEAKPKKARAKKAPAAALTTIDTAELQEREVYAREVLEHVSNWTLSTQEDMNDAGLLLAEVVEKGKELDEKLKSITAPMREAEKQVRDLFRPARQFCESSEAALKGLMRKFELAQREAQRAALALVQESGGEADASTLVVAHGHDQVQLADTVSARRVLKFRVTDPSLIEDKYFTRILNEKMIEGEIKLTDGKCLIPGIEVYEDVQISNKARR